MKKLISLLLLLFWSVIIVAAPKTKIKGFVVDQTTGKPIEWADVVVSDLTDKVLAQAEVEEGTFLISDVPVGDVLLLVRLIGYETYISEKIFLKSGQTFNVGEIKMQPLAIGLQEVTVVGEKNQIIYKLDRQSISGSASVVASSGTAVDILANTPSVLVDADGNMTFRGSSNFLVYVDGKPSPLEGTAALKQIPAGIIEDVEIITTPSARYKTEGGVGIINVTTKRNRVSGLSGLVNVSGGTLGTWSTDATINYRKGKHNWYVGGTAQDIR